MSFTTTRSHLAIRFYFPSPLLERTDHLHLPYSPIIPRRVYVNCPKPEILVHPAPISEVSVDTSPKPSTRRPSNMKAPKSKLSSASRTSALPKRGILKKSSSKARSNDGPSASAAQSASTDGAKREKKRLKTDSLAWKPVNTSNIVGIDDGGGMMMLEELEDVGVEWEEAETGTKVAHFVVCPLRCGRGGGRTGVASCSVAICSRSQDCSGARSADTCRKRSPAGSVKARRELSSQKQSKSPKQLPTRPPTRRKKQPTTMTRTSRTRACLLSQAWRRWIWTKRMRT